MSQTIKVLFTEKDRETLQPVLEALRAKGLRVSRYEDELGVNTGFDGYNPDDYNW